MNSTRYAIGQAVLQAVQALAVEQECDVLFNPRLPIDLKGRKTRILFVIERGDRLTEQPGQRERRRARLVVGAMSTPAADADLDVDADVDALHFAARAALKAMRKKLEFERNPSALQPREVEVEPELKESIGDAALLLSAYEIEYYEIYPGA